jgi:hypothetical protein
MKNKTITIKITLYCAGNVKYEMPEIIAHLRNYKLLSTKALESVVNYVKDIQRIVLYIKTDYYRPNAYAFGAHRITNLINLLNNFKLKTN